jgi:hypothetical protein
MSQRWEFADATEFVRKLREIIASGVRPEQLRILMPYHVHEVDEIMLDKRQPVEFIGAAGAVVGVVCGLGLTYGTALAWPLVTGGKPLVSIMQYGIISLELALLFGAIASFVGFLILARLPAIDRITAPEDHNGRFVISMTEMQAEKGQT